MGSTDHLNVVGRIELEEQFQWFCVQRFKGQSKKLSKIWFYLSYYITPKQVPCSSGWYSPSEWHICWTLILFESEVPNKKRAEVTAKSKLTLRDIASKRGQSYWKVFWTNLFKTERCSAIFSNQNYSAISQPAIMEVLHIPTSVITIYWPY